MVHMWLQERTGIRLCRTTKTEVVKLLLLGRILLVHYEYSLIET